MTKLQKTDLMDDVEIVLGRRKAFLTVKEFAQVTNRHEQTIYKSINEGKITARQTKPGGRILISYLEISHFMEGKTQ